MARKRRIGYTKRRDPVWEFFSSVKLTIPLVIFIATVSIIGTVIKQFPSQEDLETLYTPAQIEWFERLGFFDVYGSWWFQLSLVLLATNLIVCSIERIPGVIRVIRNPRERLNQGAWKNMPIQRVITVPEGTIDAAADKISETVEGVFGKPKRFDVSGEAQLFAEAGSYSRLAPYLVHIALLVILAGAFLGGAFGYRGAMSVFEGESNREVRLFKSGGTVGMPFSIRCDDFDVKFYPDGTPRDFKSDVTLLDARGEEIRKETIRVNHPIKEQGIRIYQASYGQSAKLTLEMWPGVPPEGFASAPPSPLAPEELAKLGGFAPQRMHPTGTVPEPTPVTAPSGWDPNRPLHTVEFSPSDAVRFPRGGPTLQIMDLRTDMEEIGTAVQVGLQRPDGTREIFWLFERLPVFDSAIRRGPEVFVLRGIEPWFYTGLQITKDPGVEIVWIGCSLLMLGLVWAFFYNHKRLWVRLVPKDQGVEITLAGAVNKNKLGYVRVFDEMVNDIREALGLEPVPLEEESY